VRRIPVSERAEQVISEELENQSGGKLLQRLLQGGLVKVITRIVEQEVGEHLGRGYYERRGTEEPHRGYRNGYRERGFQSSEGEVRVPVPRVRECAEPFRSQLLEQLAQRTERLEQMVVEMYARGLSTRDIQEVLRDEDSRVLVGRSSVSRIAEELWEEYEAFSQADLSGYEVEYLWLDAVYEPMRRWLPRKEGILAAWAVCRNGAKVLLGLDVGLRESQESWTSFVHDLVRRGLREPVLIVTDGNPGLLAAVGACFPGSWRQRCTFHKKRNVLGKVPEGAQEEVNAWLEAIFTAPDLDSGRQLADEFIRRYERDYPRAVASFGDDLEASLTHLRFPISHRRSIRTTNSIERLFGEQKRRTKVIPRFFDEKSCLKLAFAALIRGAAGFRCFCMSDVVVAQLETLREQKNLALMPTLNYSLANELRKAA
jgi:putative transposase